MSRLALTFDDGPHPQHTPRVLEALAAHGARATFFLVGRQVERFPEIARAVRDAGHEVGCHSYRHRHAWLLSPSATRQEVAAGAAVVERVLGSRPRLYRPPWGARNPWLRPALREVGQELALWTLDGGDWLPWATVGWLARRVGEGAAPRSVVDLHDNRAVLAAALPRVLLALSRRGLRCVPLSEL